MPVAINPPAIHSKDRLLSPGAHMVSDAGEQSQWLFAEDEVQLAPSIVDGGLSAEKERENRSKGVNFILQAGIMLKLPQITLYTSSVFLHRFYMRHSMVDSPSRGPGYHYYSMAATCLFLATKVEENCRKMKELVIACVRVAQKDPYKMVDEQDKEYWRWRDNILHNEDVLLEAICFDMSLEPPYKTLFELLCQFHVETNKKLRNAAWSFVNDSCMTMLCLQFPSKVIAASAFYAAAKYTGIAFMDDDEGRPWWNSVSVDVSEIRRACNYMADMYERVQAKPGREGMTYERTPDHNEATDRTRIQRSSVERQDSRQASLEPAGSAAGSKRERGVMEEDENTQPTSTFEATQTNGTLAIISPKRRKVSHDDDEDREASPMAMAADQTSSDRKPDVALTDTRGDGPAPAYGTSASKPNNTSADIDPADVSEEGEVEA